MKYYKNNEIDNMILNITEFTKGEVWKNKKSKRISSLCYSAWNRSYERNFKYRQGDILMFLNIMSFIIGIIFLIAGMKVLYDKIYKSTEELNNISGE